MRKQILDELDEVMKGDEDKEEAPEELSPLLGAGEPHTHVHTHT